MCNVLQIKPNKGYLRTYMPNGDIIGQEIRSKVVTGVGDEPYVVFEVHCRSEGIEGEGLQYPGSDVCIRTNGEKLVAFNKGIEIPGVEWVRLYNQKDTVVNAIIKAKCVVE